MRIKLCGEENKSIADCYYSLGITQHNLVYYKAAFQSHELALGRRIKVFLTDHKSVAASNRAVGKTMRVLDGL